MHEARRDGGRLDLIDLVVISANRQPALAADLPDERGDCRGYGIMVLDIDDGAVVTITGFQTRRCSPRSGCL